MKSNNYNDLKSKLNKIDFNKDEKLNSYKNELLSIFNLSKFNVKSFNDFANEYNESLLNKNLEVYNNYNEVLNQIDKSLNIALEKNSSEVKNVTENINEQIKNLTTKLNEYKSEYNENIFNLRINNETQKSDNYAFFEEEISQINSEEKELKEKYLISLSKLEHDKKIKIDNLNKNYNTKVNEINEHLNSLSKPYDLKIRSLKEKLNNEIENKDNTYLTIKKTHNQSSVKLNEFIDNIRTTYKDNATNIKNKHLNKLNDLSIDIEDLNEYFNSIVNIIKDEHNDKIKALDIVFDVQRSDHEKNVSNLIKENNENITKINSKYRELRNKVNNKISDLEKEKNKLLLKTKDYDERSSINSKYNKIISPLNNEILIINNKNEIELDEQNKIFESNLFNQDLNHLKNVNEWRYTKDLYDSERNLKLDIEKSKYEHELFTLTEKESLYNKQKEIELNINQINMEKDLLPIESQLHFSSSLQSRDISLLNIEFDSFKLNNELELKLLYLNNKLKEQEYRYNLKLLKESLKFDTKIIEVTYQLYTEKEIIKRDRDISVLNLQKKLQETLLNQKNERQENILQGKINKLDIKLELFNNDTTYNIRKLNHQLNIETQKRNFIILNIKNKIQQNKSSKFSNRNINISLNNTEFNESLNKYILDYLLRNYQSEKNLINIYFDMFKNTTHPKIMRQLPNLIIDFDNNVLKNNYEAIQTLKEYEKLLFNEKIESLFNTKYQFKHEELINKFDSRKNALKAIVDDLNRKIDDVNKEQIGINKRIENNNLVINSLKYSSSSINQNEKEQINLLQDEIRSNIVLLKNNKKLKSNLLKQVKVHNNILLQFTLDELKEEKELKKQENKEKKFYYKLHTSYEKEIDKLILLLDNSSIKYQSLVNKINGNKYLDDKQLSTFYKLFNKFFDELNEKLIKQSFNVLSIWKKLHNLTLDQENKVVNKFEINSQKSIKQNNNNFIKYTKLINKEDEFLNKLFNQENNRLNKELVNIQNNTNLTITETHNIYHIFYNKTEKNINNIQTEASSNIKLVNDNLNEVIKHLKNDKIKSINKIKTTYASERTKLLTDEILAKNELKALNQKTNQRYSIILSRYDQNRKNHLNNMKKIRNTLLTNINNYKKDIKINEESYNIVISKNLSNMKNDIKEFNRDFNSNKRSLRRSIRRELRANRKKLRHSLKFKIKQINKKRK